MKTLKLYLSPTEGRRFKVIVIGSGAGEGETESSLPFFAQEKNWRSPLLRCLEMTAFNSQYFQDDEQEWMVASGILDTNRHNFNPKYLENIGQKLFQALFPPDSKVKNALLASLRAHEQENTQLHIQLSFSDEVRQGIRLADYPWELLHDSKKFLLHRNVTISRYIAYEDVPPNLPPTEKINVLLLSSTASDTDLGLNKLGDREIQAIRHGLETARNDGHINFVQLGTTRDKLRAYLTEHRGEEAPQVMHFDGHGLYGKRCPNPQCSAINKGNKIINCCKCNTVLQEAQGYLVFEDGNGGADYVSAEELGMLLSKSSLGDGNNKSDGIALVVLSACQSAMTVDGDSVFNGTAQNLIGQRIPSVVAMQYSVSVVSATKFAEQFYRSLGQRNSLGIAVSQAREAMGVEGNQWYRPVLYLRWEDNEGGQLFKDFLVTSDVVIPDKEILKEENKPPQIPRLTQIRTDNLKNDLDKLAKDYDAVANKKRRESNPQEQNNLQLQLDEIAQQIEFIEQQLQELGYGYE
ncbi:CHAT domain-containing protein [Nostoc sp. RF31YmG]|nr:CHAT domain-containing protein [Nostoc sp. RF31YmG]